MFIIGVTGGIACGKSEVARIIARKGIKVIDADLLSHEVTENNQSAIKRIIEEFGEQILDDNHKISRKKLAEIVFADRKSLDVLSMIVHEEVIKEIKLRVEKLKKSKEKVLVLDVPLPVKDGFINICDKVIVVWADEKLRIKRLMENRGMDITDIKKRMNMQMSEDEYKSFADIIIDNSSSLEDLEKKVNGILERELEIRGIKV